MAGELRAPLILVESVEVGDSAVRSDLIINEALTEGSANILSSYMLVESLSEGNRNLLVPFLFLEALHPIAPEEYMATDTFPGFGNSTIDPSLPEGADPFSTALPGVSFSVHKKPNFKTRIAEAAGGQEDRNALWQYPRWDFELPYEYLEDRTGAQSSLKTLMGFFLNMGGSFKSWLFKDPDDYLVTDGVQAATDGVTTQFFFMRSLGGFYEVVGQVDTANTINLYLDGVLVSPSLYTITMPNYVVFTTAPVTGKVLTADFQFFFVCRFMEDVQDFEKFADKLWNLQSCEFRSLV